MRIVSLLPSATDIIDALGAGSELVGVSHSCDEKWHYLPVLTSTRIDKNAESAEIDRQVKSTSSPLYDLDISILEKLKPDIIVSQSLCDVCAVASGDVEIAISAISSQPKLVNLSPFSLADIPTGFEEVGSAINKIAEAQALTSMWNKKLASVENIFTSSNPLKIAFLDWLDPPFAGGHWIPDMIELTGCHSALAKSSEPSYEITWDEVRLAKPDIIIAACCGFAANRAKQDRIPNDIEIQFLDGYQYFSRPSPNLMKALDILISACQQADKRMRLV